MSDEIKTFNNDPEFDILIQPYSGENLEKVKKALSEDESLRVIHVLDNTVMMDNEKYKIINELNLSYQVHNHYFPNKLQAALYICLHQLKRPDLTDGYRKFLIGEEFYLRKEIKTICHEIKDNKSRLSMEVGQTYNLSGCSIIRYSNFASAYFSMYSKDKDFTINLLLEKYKFSYETLIELSRLKTDELRAVAKAMDKSDTKRITLGFIRAEVKHRYSSKFKLPAQYEEDRIKKEAPPAIRQMPAYDPDSEVNSLCMTISYWISSIKRVNDNVNFDRITTKARVQLMKELSYLGDTISTIQESLVERAENNERAIQ